MFHLLAVPETRIEQEAPDTTEATEASQAPENPEAPDAPGTYMEQEASETPAAPIIATL